MPNESEVLYDSRQVAEVLGVGSAMLRRYASAFEELTGKQLPLHRRLGRQFTREQVEMLKLTRDGVQRSGLSVEVSMQRALGFAEMLPELEQQYTGGIDAQKLTEALTEAYTRANAPLLQELRKLRLELAESQRRESPSKDKQGEISPRVSSESDANRPDQTRDGFLVRLARRLERVIGRR